MKKGQLSEKCFIQYGNTGDLACSLGLSQQLKYGHSYHMVRELTQYMMAEVLLQFLNNIDFPLAHQVQGQHIFAQTWQNTTNGLTLSPPVAVSMKMAPMDHGEWYY